MTRIYYKDKPFPAHDTHDMTRGDILIDNVGYGQYKGETQIALKEMKNDGRVNVVGKIAADELFLLDFLKPWSSFKLKTAKTNKTLCFLKNCSFERFFCLIAFVRAVWEKGAFLHVDEIDGKKVRTVERSRLLAKISLLFTSLLFT